MKKIKKLWLIAIVTAAAALIGPSAILDAVISTIIKSSDASQFDPNGPDYRYPCIREELSVGALRPPCLHSSRHRCSCSCHNLDPLRLT